jgi:hypothetical protein
MREMTLLFKTSKKASPKDRRKIITQWYLIWLFHMYNPKIFTKNSYNFCKTNMNLASSKQFPRRHLCFIPEALFYVEFPIILAALICIIPPCIKFHMLPHCVTFRMLPPCIKSPMLLPCYIPYASSLCCIPDASSLCCIPYASSLCCIPYASSLC